MRGLDGKYRYESIFNELNRLYPNFQLSEEGQLLISLVKQIGVDNVPDKIISDIIDQRILQFPIPRYREEIAHFMRDIVKITLTGPNKMYRIFEKLYYIDLYKFSKQELSDFINEYAKQIAEDIIKNRPDIGNYDEIKEMYESWFSKRQMRFVYNIHGYSRERLETYVDVLDMMLAVLLDRERRYEMEIELFKYSRDELASLIYNDLSLVEDLDLIELREVVVYLNISKSNYYKTEDKLLDHLMREIPERYPHVLQ